MANLHVQPKRRSNAWIIWILVIILIVAAAVYYYYNYYKKGITPGDKVFRESPSLQLKLTQVPLKNYTHAAFVC